MSVWSPGGSGTAYTEYGPMPFAEAARVWAAAAGIAGAYLPPEFAALAALYLPGDSSADAPVEILEELLREADSRALWRAKYCGAPDAGFPFGIPEGSYIPPRGAEVIHGRLEWQTSVCTVLCPAEDGGWLVRIEGEHPERQAAAQAAFEATP